MMSFIRNLVFVQSAVLLCAASVSATPIAIDSYVYQNPDEWAFHNSTPAGEDGQTVKTLIDGFVEPFFFADQVGVGFAHAGPHPGTIETAIPIVDFDLGGTHQVGSVEVNYVIVANAFVFAPQDGMTILASTNGTDFNQVGFKNDFPTVAESQAANTSGVQSAVFDFGSGVTASHLRLDVRTPNTFYFMTEFSATQIPEPGSLALLGLGAIRICLAVCRRHS